MLFIFTFLLSIFVLVSFHELGHLVVARLCKVKVLKYSIGFGKPIFSKVFKGIQWSISPILLGGYVKMLDTREGFVKEDDLKFAFDKQHPWKKILIVIAGPVANLILSIVIFSFIFSFGVEEVKPIVGTVIHDSFAYKVGFEAEDEILSINNKPINSLEEAFTILITNLDNKGNKVSVKILDKNKHIKIINISTIRYHNEIKQLLKKQEIGILPVKLTTLIAQVVPDSPAQMSGLKVGDKLISINGYKSDNWLIFNKIIKNNPDRELDIVVIRTIYNFNQIVNNSLGLGLKTKLVSNNIKYNIKITPSIIDIEHGTKIQGYIGVVPKIDDLWNKKIYTYRKLRFNEILPMAIAKTWFYIKMNISLIINLILGKASLSNIGGPISIANITSEAMELGVFVYLKLLALLSISLGILNLFPIPILDGGHILYYIIEWIKGTAISEKAQMFGLRFSMIIMGLLIIILCINDLKNIFG